MFIIRMTAGGWFKATSAEELASFVRSANKLGYAYTIEHI